ncbi:hypothetical protein GF354_01745 [Candidatus Peregrinibacteria bacterium]|nr:hypothetical protein [Candidatus Peregrinibacteria bacterium]
MGVLNTKKSDVFNGGFNLFGPGTFSKRGLSHVARRAVSPRLPKHTQDNRDKKCVKFGTGEEQRKKLMQIDPRLKEADKIKQFKFTMGAYIKLMKSMGETAKEISEIYRKSCPKTSIGLSEINKRLSDCFMDLWGLSIREINDQQAFIGENIDRKEEYFESLRQKYKKMVLSRGLIGTIPRADVAKLDLDKLITVERHILPITKFKEDPGYKEYFNEIMSLIKDTFVCPKKFEQEFLNDPKASAHLVTCGDQWLVFHGATELPGSIRELDWFLANPNTLLKGLAQSAFVTAEREYESCDSYAICLPQSKSLSITIEELGYVGFGQSTDNEVEKNKFIRIRKLKDEKPQNYISKNLSDSDIRKLQRIARRKVLLKIDAYGKPLIVTRVEFNNKNHTNNLLEDGDGEDLIYKYMENFSSQGFVLTRYIPEQTNTSKFKAYTCIFELKNDDKEAQEAIQNLDKCLDMIYG